MRADLQLGIAYHEKINQDLGIYLRCMMHEKSKRWCTWLSLTWWYYNTSYHSAIKMSPFETLYGIKPPQLALGPYLQTNVTIVETYVQERKIMDKLLKKSVTQVQAQMKHYPDKRRNQQGFSIGFWDYLCLQPYRQSSLGPQGNLKQSIKYNGLFQIVQKVGKMAYYLQLLTESKIHPFFHVSLLKKKIGEHVVSIAWLPKLGDEKGVQRKPKKVLETRMVTRANAAIVQWLVNQRGLEKESATWEDTDKIINKFPDFKPRGHAFT